MGMTFPTTVAQDEDEMETVMADITKAVEGEEVVIATTEAMITPEDIAGMNTPTLSVSST